MSGPREILFIAHRIPYPPDRGDKIRSYNMLRHLARLAPVHLAALADDPRDLLHGEALDRLTASHCVRPRNSSRVKAAATALLRGEPLSIPLFRDASLQAYVDHIVATRPLSAIFVFSGNMVSYVPSLPHGTRLAVDFCDVDSVKFAAYGAKKRGPMAWVHRREGRLLGAWEAKVSRRADAAFIISEPERAVFAVLPGADLSDMAVVGNGVDLCYWDPALDVGSPTLMEEIAGPKIVFTGQMDYRPNIEAVIDFAGTAMPIIRRSHPDAHFIIVGRNPPDAVRALGTRPGIVVTGEVADTRAYLKAADIVVAPLRLARGVQNKVLEAMAMARPVIVSVAAAEGIDASHGRDFMVARDAQDEAGQSIALLDDPDRARALGLSARRRMEDRYGWDAALAPLGKLVLGHAG